MEQDVKKMIDDKDCVICKHVGESIGGSCCLGCISSGTKCNFEIMHTCLTCTHTSKKMTETPCAYCDIKNGNTEWEELGDGGES